MPPKPTSQKNPHLYLICTPCQMGIGYLLQNATAASIFVFRPSCSKSPSGVLSGFSETHGWYCVSLPVFCDVDGNSRWGPSTSSGSLPALWENAGTGILAVGTTFCAASFFESRSHPSIYCLFTE